MTTQPDRPSPTAPRPTPGQYRELVRAHLAPLFERAARSTRLPLVACPASVSARDLHATVDLPLFENSQMDGYAVRSADVAAASPDAPVGLRVVGAVHAGDGPGPGVDDDEACRIMTGAPVPEGADCVIPVEDTSVGAAAAGSGSPETVWIHAARSAGEFVRRPGEDVRAGDLVFPAGTLLQARHLAAAASLGESALDVRPRPRVAVVATGSELVAPGQPLGPGQIWESNSLTLAAALKACGCEVTATLTSSDDRDEFTAALDSATGDTDLVVTVGAVSMGDAEVVRQVLDGRDGSRFAPIAMQPGGPQGMSTWRGTPVICLPGNPVSALVSFTVLLRPAILEAVGRAPVPPVRARLSRDVTSPRGKVQYLRAALGPANSSANGTVPSAEPVSGPGSHLVVSMARADVLVEIPADVTSLAAGAEVDAIPL